MFQKQKDFDPTEPKKDQSKIGDDPALKSAADKAKSVMAELDKAAKKKHGHWEECCGIRYWVED